MCRLMSWLRWSVFPLLFGGSAVVAACCHTPDHIGWLMPLLLGSVLLLAFVLERLLPFAAEWNQGQGRAGDLVYLGLTTVSVHVAEALVWALVLMAATSWIPLVSTWWPQTWPLWLQVLLAVALGDLLPYFYHRASHETGGWLWRVHAVHHAPQRLYSLNFARFHPLNAALTAGLTLLPLALLGVPERVLFVAAVLHNVHGVLSHANIDVRLGWLNRIFSMAELHRWHHARDLSLANGNYGATLALWDWLFGTRRDPGRAVAATAVGLAAVPSQAPPRAPWRCCGNALA